MYFSHQDLSPADIAALFSLSNFLLVVWVTEAYNATL